MQQLEVLTLAMISNLKWFYLDRFHHTAI